MNITERLAQALVQLDPNVADPELQYELYEEKYNKQATVLLEAIGLNGINSYDTLLDDTDIVVKALTDEEVYWDDPAGFSDDSYKACEYAKRIVRYQRQRVGL